MQLQLKIQIKGIAKPPVWRKVLVPDQFTFEQLHLVIQAAFGWGNYHLYAFSPKGYGSNPEIGIPDEDWDDREIVDSRKTKLSAILNAKGQKFTYIYDFGDDWEHSITVEEVIDKKAIRATLISGKGICPPEDCGGIWGYENFLEIIANPKHPEYEATRGWAGLLEEDEQWDKNNFNVADHQDEVSTI